MRVPHIPALVALAIGATGAGAACLSDAQATALVAAMQTRSPAANPEDLSEADGACSRAKVSALLAPTTGRVVGYKAGLTNPAVQKRFNYDKPVWGKLYERMLLPDGAEVDALGGGKGSDVLDHPLNAVVWLAQALAKEGLALQAGDLVSLGSFSALLPPKAGLHVTATYRGLPGAEPVRVRFK